MGHLPWREKGTRLGCWRGWLGILGLATFALAGYFAFYAWLRATDVIKLYTWDVKAWKLSDVIPEEGYGAKVRDNSTDIQTTINPETKWPRSWAMRAMWPAVRLEVALHRRGWLPWSGIPHHSVGVRWWGG